MGHIVGKDMYKKLAQRHKEMLGISPWNAKFQAILEEFYTPEEAWIVVNMSHTLSTISFISRLTKIPEQELLPKIEAMCNKGIIMDILIDGHYEYAPSPLVIGFFEFSLMRVDPNLPIKEWAKLFSDYMAGDPTMYQANFGHGEKVSSGRALVYEEAFPSEYSTEILAYESAINVIDAQNNFGISTCACRHEKLHLGTKNCDHPLDTCITMNNSADFTIRHGFAKQAAKEQIAEKIAEAKSRGLVLICDNVKNKPGFICCCCGCCCAFLTGVNKFGFLNTVTTSSYIAKIDEAKCIGCGKCIKACHISSINMKIDSENTRIKKAEINADKCFGCSVCTVKCPVNAITMEKRTQKVLHPEDFFEKTILSYIERGLLQNLVFPNPQRADHRFARILLGAFFRLNPVQKALMSETFRSRFLNNVKRPI